MVWFSFTGKFHKTSPSDESRAHCSLTSLFPSMPSTSILRRCARGQMKVIQRLERHRLKPVRQGDGRQAGLAGFEGLEQGTHLGTQGQRPGIALPGQIQHRHVDLPVDGANRQVHGMAIHQAIDQQVSAQLVVDLPLCFEGVHAPMHGQHMQSDGDGKSPQVGPRIQNHRMVDAEQHMLRQLEGLGLPYQATASTATDHVRTVAKQGALALNHMDRMLKTLRHGTPFPSINGPGSSPCTPAAPVCGSRSVPPRCGVPPPAGAQSVTGRPAPHTPCRPAEPG